MASGVFMEKVAVVVLADTETHADMGRVANALQTTKELKEAGDNVVIIFDGAGTKWVSELAEKGNPLNPLFDQVKDKMVGACAYCAGAFGAKEDVQSFGVALLDEYEGHPSMRKLISEGYQIITF